MYMYINWKPKINEKTDAEFLIRQWLPYNRIYLNEIIIYLNRNFIHMFTYITLMHVNHSKNSSKINKIRKFYACRYLKSWTSAIVTAICVISYLRCEISAKKLHVCE